MGCNIKNCALGTAKQADHNIDLLYFSTFKLLRNYKNTHKTPQNLIRSELAFLLQLSAHHDKPQEARRAAGSQCYLGWAGVGVFDLLGEHVGHRSEFAPNSPNQLKHPFSFLKQLAYSQGRAYEAC